eukprot:m.29158 g.29158  ORF g.29158 m.29158 type:complete len:514 (-) comp16048_c0_seq2:53-1594(-)
MERRDVGTGTVSSDNTLGLPLIEIQDFDEDQDDEITEEEYAAAVEFYDEDKVPELAHRPRSHSVVSFKSPIAEALIPGISTALSSSFTFTNFIIQPANPVNLPIACKQAGLVVYPLLVLLFAAANCFTCNLLADAIAIVGHNHAVGFAELLANRFGRVGWYAGALAVIFANFGSLVFSIILVGDMITPLIGLATGNDVLCSDWLWNVIVAVVILTPMAFIKNMSQLDQASQVAVIIIIILVLCFVGYAIYLASEPQERTHFGDSTFSDECTRKETFDPPGDTYRAGPESLAFFSALSNLAFSFNAQANVFPLYAELKERNPTTMKRVNRNAMAMSAVIFIAAGMFGYVAFLNATKSNCVNNFPVKGGFGYFMDVVRFLLAISVITAYPLTLWECRSHMEQMVANDADTATVIARKRFGMSMVLIVLSTVIAVAAKDVGVIFGFFGATACPLLMFILPTLNHLKMHRPQCKSHTHLPLLGEVNWADWKDKCALGVLIGSVLIVPLALYSWGTSL